MVLGKEESVLISEVSLLKRGSTVYHPNTHGVIIQVSDIIILMQMSSTVQCSSTLLSLVSKQLLDIRWT